MTMTISVSACGENAPEVKQLTAHEQFQSLKSKYSLATTAVVGSSRVGGGGEWEITADANYDFLSITWKAVYEDSGGWIGIHDGASATCSKQKANWAFDDIASSVIEAGLPMPNQGFIFKVTFETGRVVTDAYGNDSYEKIRDYGYDRVGISTPEFLKINLVDENQDGFIDMSNADFFALSDLFTASRDTFPTQPCVTL